MLDGCLLPVLYRFEILMYYGKQLGFHTECLAKMRRPFFFVFLSVSMQLGNVFKCIVVVLVTRALKCNYIQSTMKDNHTTLTKDVGCRGRVKEAAYVGANWNSKP